eukprot:COSAG01_NODE_12001_length_1815_cov_2.298429_1_plen_155_part_00
MTSARMGGTVWESWVGVLRGELELRGYVRVGAGLGISSDCEGGRRLLLALALALFPGSEAAPYDIGPVTIGQVTLPADAAEAGAAASSAESHSTNDLPAPPHTAGFFEAVPPLANAFACIRPHPSGGAETFVVDTAKIIAAADPEHLQAWRSRK